MTILWLGPSAYEKLPPDVRRLEACGLTVKTTNDIGPYTKIIPCLSSNPEAFIVTGDDDVYYSDDWLERLVEAYDPNSPSIICHRAHRVAVDGDGKPLSYRLWEYEVRNQDVSPYLLPTGVGGVLYYPGALPNETLRADIFQQLSARADDIWLYWMQRVAGRTVRTLGHRRALVCWPNSHLAGLYRENTGENARNDLYVENMYSRYGLPLQTVQMGT